MYKDFYGLTAKPFSIVPNPDCLYMTSKHQLALTYLQYGISENLGFILLTGEIGTGKTTLIRHILRQIDMNMEVAVIFNTQISGNQLIEMILSEFELPHEANDKSKNLDILNDFLIEKYAQNRKVVIVIDEAQNLSMEVLEEVRMLSNLQSESNMLLQIMLVGQPELKAKIKRPELAQLTQRIAVNYHLGPLSREEVGNYIAFRLDKAGGNPNLFTPQAVDLIHEFSGGIPRAINLLCDAALVYGFADELTSIEPAIIEQVAADKQGIGINSVATPGEPAPPNSLAKDQDASALLQRIATLERTVEKLSLQVQWQMQELENRATSFQDKLITTLKEQLKLEREKADASQIQYTRIKETYLALKRTIQASRKQDTQPTPVIQASLDKPSPVSLPHHDPAPPDDPEDDNRPHKPAVWKLSMSCASLFVIILAGIVLYRTC
ncbi:XrtA/PEP-CTERM system-associated ATPase [Desulfoplanes formicivorans]|uniref:AAA+ ATPase domain-containing protein n=1 Tax=Desulfoplanes formicivorans TaxID=1592317 RepID=A0A194AJK4_9BACT|nr:XrtA/PEP-CTERM system-associated ATPase [Desulfoplanes formicivorans]GAU08919.1 hypothetical protein DPF_1638 [Desulfoplanes formicivorans]